MQSRVLVAVIFICSATVWAADKIVPPDVKLGLWEITETHNMSGMSMTIPPEALARMTPEQRAKMEEQMKGTMGGGQKPKIRQYCVTKEKLEKDSVFGDEREQCTRTVLASSPTMTEVKLQCKANEMTSDGTFKFEALSKENVKGTMRMVMTGRGQNMKMDMDFVAKYLSPVCGDVK